ncbi:siderophore ferric iron reductase [Enterovibrio calviensis]|uniref:siderophore ferric iron reductase n=1 Tax=Enterovibrio calviensis TaxID=91359 RepID=UPI0037366650
MEEHTSRRHQPHGDESLKQPSALDNIFAFSEQVSPSLKGEIGPVTPNSLHIGHPCASLIKGLYEDISTAHPEAGSAYWLTRTWDLLCWQPVYVAFLSIYGFKTLPDMRSISQCVHSQFVGGYRFESDTHLHDEESRLISKAGEELQVLLTYFRHEMSTWTRIRPGFTNHLLADLLLGCIVKMQLFMPHIPAAHLLLEAKRWLAAFDLSEKHMQSMHINEESGALSFVRISCCLVYRCDNGVLCDDCPRATKIESHQF